MKCDRCGFENYDEAYACRSCGAKPNKSRRKANTVQSDNYPYGSPAQKQPNNFEYQHSYQQRNTQQNSAFSQAQQQGYANSRSTANNPYRDYPQHPSNTGQHYNPADTYAGTYQAPPQQQYQPEQNDQYQYNNQSDNQYNNSYADTQQTDTTGANTTYQQNHSYSEPFSDTAEHYNNYNFNSDYSNYNNSYNNPNTEKQSFFETVKTTAQNQARHEAQFKADIPIGRLVAIIALTSVLIMSLTVALAIWYGTEHSPKGYVYTGAVNTTASTEPTEPEYQPQTISANWVTPVTVEFLAPTNYYYGSTTGSDVSIVTLHNYDEAVDGITIDISVERSDGSIDDAISKRTSNDYSISSEETLKANLGDITLVTMAKNEKTYYSAYLDLGNGQHLEIYSTLIEKGNEDKAKDLIIKIAKSCVMVSDTETITDSED